MEPNKPRSKVWLIALIVFLAAAAFLLRPETATDRIDPDQVQIVEAERGDLVVSILQSGELRSKNSRDILNEAYRNAKIIWIVDDGATVTNGQLLIELESSELMERYLDQQSDVAEAEAELELAQENLEIARLKNATDVKSASLKVELAKLDLQKYEEVEYKQEIEKAESSIMLSEEELEKARSELEGTQELYDKGYSNKNDLDSARLNVQRKEIDVRNKRTDLAILRDYTHVKKQKELQNNVTNAEAELERLQKTIAANIQSMEAAILSKKTRLEIEKNQLATRETQFENTKVYADFDGQVFYPKGNRWGGTPKIEKGATVNYRQTMLKFPDLAAWELKVGIPEAMIDKVALKQNAFASLDAVPHMILEGTVDKISPVPDSQRWFSSGVKTYTIIVDVTSYTNGQLKPGMSSTVEILTDHLTDVIHVPLQSVVSKDDKHFVYAVEAGRKTLREVQVGKFNNHRIEITEGLKQGEQLVLYADVVLEADSRIKKSPLEENAKRNGDSAK